MWVGSHFVVWCLAAVEWLWSECFLSCWSALFLDLCLERSRHIIFIFFYFHLCYWSFWVAHSSALSLEYTRQKENWALHHHVPWLPRSLPGLPSLHCSDSSYVCFLYNVWGFQLCLVGRIGKSMSAPFPQNLESTLWPALNYSSAAPPDPPLLFLRKISPELTSANPPLFAEEDWPWANICAHLPVLYIWDACRSMAFAKQCHVRAQDPNWWTPARREAERVRLTAVPPGWPPSPLLLSQSSSKWFQICPREWESLL